MREYAVVIEGDDEQGYSAYSPDVPGVAAAAGDRGEVARAMREAVTARVGDGARIVVADRPGLSQLTGSRTDRPPR